MHDFFALASLTNSFFTISIHLRIIYTHPMCLTEFNLAMNPIISTSYIFSTRNPS